MSGDSCGKHCPVPASGPRRLPTWQDVREATDRIRGRTHRTPVHTCASIDRVVGARVWFKCESFQKVGAFKFRGATNAVWSLSDEEAQRGVATHSSGNHGAALALAASQRGIDAHIVMPENATAVKKSAVAGYGARIIYCEQGRPLRRSKRTSQPSFRPMVSREPES